MLYHCLTSLATRLVLPVHVQSAMHPVGCKVIQKVMTACLAIGPSQAGQPGSGGPHHIMTHDLHYNDIIAHIQKSHWLFITQKARPGPAGPPGPPYMLTLHAGRYASPAYKTPPYLIIWGPGGGCWGCQCWLRRPGRAGRYKHTCTCTCNFF